MHYGICTNLLLTTATGSPYQPTTFDRHLASTFASLYHHLLPWKCLPHFSDNQHTVTFELQKLSRWFGNSQGRLYFSCTTGCHCTLHVHVYMYKSPMHGLDGLCPLQRMVSSCDSYQILKVLWVEWTSGMTYTSQIPTLQFSKVYLDMLASLEITPAPFAYKIHGNLKVESVVSAILPSYMEVSYCTSGFFRN